jgi:hypothetical protein
MKLACRRWFLTLAVYQPAKVLAQLLSIINANNIEVKMTVATVK